MKRNLPKNEDEDDDKCEQVQHIVFSHDKEPYNFTNEVSSATKLKIDFEMDLFQVEAIKAINTDGNIVTIASTSSGKSIIAYHAISRSVECGFTSIYTAPVKSLANQKYAELCNIFENVGIITGDVSNNPEADVIVMTAEVLRNHLITYSSLINRCRYIILDEAHYIGDDQRGVVWEQILIQNQSNLRFVLLTATLPNGNELSQWISNITKTDVHMVIQDKRPVPLKIFALSQSKPTAIIKSGEEQADMECIVQFCSCQNLIGLQSTLFSIPKDPNVNFLISNIDHLVNNESKPIIVFCLSRRKCIDIAKRISGEDNPAALQKFDELIDFKCASFEGSEQYVLIRELVSKGIGIHHSGIQPILREIIELLFSTGYMSVLVATETFSLGVNMPAKTVVFSSLSKWSGTCFRPLNSSEFNQMAGRAGRRGFDTHGHVYIFIQEGTSPHIIKDIIDKKSEKLVSKMKVTSMMILNCIINKIKPYEFYLKSFKRYQDVAKLEFLEEQLEHCPTLDKNHEQIYDLIKINKQMTFLYTLKNNIRKSLQLGRLVYIIHNKVNWGWCPVIEVSHNNKNVKVHISFIDDKGISVPCFDITKARVSEATFPITSIFFISSIKLKDHKTMVNNENAKATLGVLDRIIESKGFVPIIMSPEGYGFQNKLTELYNSAEAIIDKLPKDYMSSISKTIIETDQRLAIESQIESIHKPPEEILIEKEIAELIKLNYITPDMKIQKKCAVAQCLKIDDPIPLVELLFSGIFNDFDLNKTCSLLSCFIEFNSKPVDNLKTKYSDIYIAIKNKLQSLVNLELFVKPHKKFIQFTYDYMTFRSITKAIQNSEEISEGMAIRILKRIKELSIMLMDASELISVQSFYTKFEAIKNIIEEDPIINASLYRVE